MEMSQESSRKRKQPSSSNSTNPFSKMLTRHMSQKLYFHHNRSGKSRKSRTFPPSLSSPNLPIKRRFCHSNRGDVVVVGNDDDINQFSIKDLRARRVFSDPSNSKVESKNCDDELGKNGMNPNFDFELTGSKLYESDESGANPKIDSGVESKGEILNCGSSNFLMAGKCDDSGVDGGNHNLSILGKCVDTRVDFEGECLNGGNPNLSIEGFGTKDDCGSWVYDDMSPNLSSKDSRAKEGEDCEENVQTTPPDAVVLVRKINDLSVVGKRSADSRSLPKQISPSKGGSVEGKKCSSNSRGNLGLNLCSRLKVFKAPNSFSYRRMLPFLMDLGMDTPSTPKGNVSIKTETSVVEKPLDSSSKDSVIKCPVSNGIPLLTATACKPQEMNTTSKEEENLSLETKTNDYSDQQAALLTPVNSSFANNRESQIESPISDYSKHEESPPDTLVSSYILGMSGDICPIVKSDHAVTLLSPKRSLESSREVDTLNTPPHLSLYAERECKSARIEKSEETSPSLFQSTTKVEAAVSSGVPGSGLAKGILKKNPRGCRGICNCLNCASFRLNAEKAFEFSRNQWLDAEEVAMELMQELTNMRSILEKSFNGPNDKAIVPVDELQEACRRASNAEDIARSRLNQMNEDLHVHCRIKSVQRPRVTFSSSAQEKILRLTN